MIQPTIHRWATSVLVMLGAGLLGGGMIAGCTGDEFTAGGDGGGGGTGVGTPTTTSTGDSTSTSTGDTTTTSSGGDCSAGCLDDGGECREEQSVEHCGLGGSTCTACDAPPTECQEAYCEGGSCKVRNAPELSECSGGACVGGVCSADAEVCLNDLDEDDDGDIGCGDADCQNAGYACSDGGEGGFMGPVLVIKGPGSASCPEGLEEGPEYYTEAAAQCGCSASEDDGGVPCSVDLTRGNFPGCDINAQATVLLPDECTPLVTTLAQGLEPTPSCTAERDVHDTAVTTLTPCVLPGFGCNEGEACMPPVPAPGAGENLLCLAAEGDVDCPDGWNEIRRLASDQPDVDCSCQCTPDPACSGTVRTWTDELCSECNEGEEACTAAPAGADPECTAVAVAGSHVVFDVAETGTPTVEGMPFLSAGNQATFCCVPYPQTGG